MRRMEGESSTTRTRRLMRRARVGGRRGGGRPGGGGGRGGGRGRGGARGRPRGGGRAGRGAGGGAPPAASAAGAASGSGAGPPEARRSRQRPCSGAVRGGTVGSGSAGMPSSLSNRTAQLAPGASNESLTRASNRRAGRGRPGRRVLG